jgi:hypothetical protein
LPAAREREECVDEEWDARDCTEGETVSLRFGRMYTFTRFLERWNISVMCLKPSRGPDANLCSCLVLSAWQRSCGFARPRLRTLNEM